jgi:hypothetical protein
MIACPALPEPPVMMIRLDMVKKPDQVSILEGSVGFQENCR